MKILFTIIVLIASVYLILPKEELTKLSSFLPKNQMEEAAGVVLSDVDKKLEQFKVKFLVDKNSRISELEKQLTTLQTQLVTQKEQLAELQLNEQSNKKSAEQALKQLSSEQLSVTQALAQNQTVTNEPLTTHLKKVVAHKSDHSIKASSKESTQQEAINRQAYLQDLVERMNKTSLLTLTK